MDSIEKIKDNQFNYLTQQYISFHYFLSSSLFLRNHSVQFLNACPKLLFSEEKFHINFNDVNYLHSDHTCKNLLDLGEIFKKKSLPFFFDDITKKKHLCACQPPQFITNYTSNEVELLKMEVNKQLSNPLELQGYVLIKDSFQDCTQYKRNHFSLYFTLLVAECLRSLAILLSPFIWRKNKRLSWDTECPQYKYTIDSIEQAYSYISLCLQQNKKQLEDFEKKKFIFMIATIKDSTIRLGISSDILYPQDSKGHLALRYLENNYLVLSDAYAITLHINENGLDDEQLWNPVLLSTIKNSKNTFNHNHFYFIAQNWLQE